VRERGLRLFRGEAKKKHLKGMKKNAREQKKKKQKTEKKEEKKPRALMRGRRLKQGNKANYFLGKKGSKRLQLELLRRK